MLRLVRIAFEWILAIFFIFLWPIRRVIHLYLGSSAFSIWCGKPIITMPLACAAERFLGVRSLSIVTHSYFITKAFDFDVSRITDSRLIRYLASWLLLCFAFLFSKRVHTYCDGGFLASTTPFMFNTREIFIYRLAGLEHIVWTYGADVRTKDVTKMLGEPNCCSGCDAPGKYCVCSSVKHDENLSNIAKSAIFFSSMGDMNEYLPDARHELFFWPINLQPQFIKDRKSNGMNSGPLRIVHASNHQRFKGSKYLIEAVQSLEKEGWPIELVLVEKVPNLEAVKIYQTADIIFDQCLIGFHGYFALEAMALGKPVMAFIRKADYLIDPHHCPIINISPDTIKESLMYFLVHRNELIEIGEKSREYVLKNYSLRAFSLRLNNAYANLEIKP